ncbi:hypothetical protein GQ54DRAFT_298430 [Martensiomyces pterosporus]|nr:hypothetical protein GQ54DRAFT_298430 [Martensiomyces pterosporus]
MESAFWLEAVNTVLVTLEGALLGENASPLAGIANSTAETRKHTRRATNETLSDMETPGSPAKRRRDSLEGTYTSGGISKPTPKSRKLSKALSSQFARSLSMSTSHMGDTACSSNQAGLGISHEHGLLPDYESVSSLSSARSSSSSLSSISPSQTSSGLPPRMTLIHGGGAQTAEPPFPAQCAGPLAEMAGATGAPAATLSRALVHPSSSRSLKSREKSKLALSKDQSNFLHQESRLSMDLDHSDSNAQSSGNEAATTSAPPVSDDVFAELLKPTPVEAYSSSGESIDVAVQRWAILQAQCTDEPPAQLVDSLRQHIARLEELVPLVVEQAMGEQRHHQQHRQQQHAALQGDRQREFCRAVCEIASIGEWLYQRHFLLLPVVLPTLPQMFPLLHEAIRLARIHEDIHSLLLWTPEFSTSIPDMTREYEELVAGKRAIYDDIISQGGLRWKAMGLPVDGMLLMRARQWMESAAGTCLSRIARAYERRAKSSSAFGKEDITTDGLVQCSTQLLHSTAACAAMCGGSLPGLAPHVLYITAECSQWICDKFKPSSPLAARFGSSSETTSASKNHPSSVAYRGKQLDSRAMRLVQSCESVIKLMSFARTTAADDRSVFELDVKVADMDHTSASLQSLAASLVDVSWTLAETLTAFRRDGQFANPSGTLLLFADFVVKFAKRVVDFGGNRPSGPGPAPAAVHHRLRHMQRYLRELESSFR